MTKKYILLIGLLVAACLHAESQEKQFLKAAQLYQQHKFQDALSLYASLDIKNSAVWENMGNCAYYLQDYPHAIVYWRKAQRYVDYKQYVLLQERIQQVYDTLQIDDDERWYERAQSFIVANMQRLPRWVWQVLFLLSWALLMLVGPCFCRNKMRSAMLGLIGITFFCGILYIIQHRYDKQNVGIVICHHASLHTGTDEKLPIVTTLKPGQKIRIAYKEQDWHRGTVGSHTGWIHKDMFEVV